MTGPDFFPDDNAFDTEDAFAALVGDTEATVVVELPRPAFGRSWAFDFAERHFEMIAGSGPRETRGTETLRYWIVKCLNTARGAHPIHPDDYGMDRPFDLIGSQFNEFEEADLADRITDALLFHPRVTNVTDFDFTFDPAEEALAASFTVVIDDADELEVTGAIFS